MHFFANNYVGIINKQICEQSCGYECCYRQFREEIFPELLFLTFCRLAFHLYFTVEGNPFLKGKTAIDGQIRSIRWKMDYFCLFCQQSEDCKISLCAASKWKTDWKTSSRWSLSIFCNTPPLLFSSLSSISQHLPYSLCCTPPPSLRKLEMKVTQNRYLPFLLQTENRTRQKGIQKFIFP